jgi:hypothetical protein
MKINSIYDLARLPACSNNKNICSCTLFNKPGIAKASLFPNFHYYPFTLHLRQIFNC